jgi:hypothetical protein
MTKLGEIIAAGLVGSVLLFGVPAAAQDGGTLFAQICFGCHNGGVHPQNLIYNAAGNVSIIELVNGKGMGAGGSLADHTAIAAYLDSIKPTINLAPVPHDSPGTQIELGDIIVSGAEQNAFLKIIFDIVTVSPPTKGTVSYQFENGFGVPSSVTYTPFPGQSGVDTWTYQGTGPEANTTIRTASVYIAADPATGPPNYQGLWWAAPAGSESGWGINFAHQGNIIFASWFTYDHTGKGLWLVMTATQAAPAVFTGALYTTTGPAFNAVPFDPAQVKPTQVGTGTLTFNDLNDGTFSYTVNGIAQVKSITRQVFGPMPTCGTATSSLTAATNYTDLWWAAPASSESGWGINLTHQGNTIFATWFTYDVDGSPMWLVVTANNTAPGVFSGQLYRTTGPPFNSEPFNPAGVVPTSVGIATFRFTDGNDAIFQYTVNGVSQLKAITRQVFSAPGTACQ